jgi:hypothetical protein
MGSGFGFNLVSGSGYIKANMALKKGRIKKIKN